MSISQFIPPNTDFHINIIYNKINLTHGKWYIYFVLPGN